VSGRVNFLWLGSGRVSHLWLGFGKFPLIKSNFLIFFPLAQKNLFGLVQKVPGSKLGQPLIYCCSKVSHLWLGFEFGQFPLKMSKFSIFCPSGQKKSLWVGSKSTRIKGWSAFYLLRIKRELRSGQGPSQQKLKYLSSYTYNRKYG